jgi:hypothetical protein
LASGTVQVCLSSHSARKLSTKLKKTLSNTHSILYSLLL